MTRKQRRILLALSPGPLTVPQLSLVSPYGHGDLGHELLVMEREGLVRRAGLLGRAKLWEQIDARSEAE